MKIKSRSQKTVNNVPKASASVSVSTAAPEASGSDGEDVWSDDEELDELLERAKATARARATKPAVSDVPGDLFALQADTIALDAVDDVADSGRPLKRRRGNTLARPVSQQDLEPRQPIASTSKAKLDSAMTKWGELPTKPLSKAAAKKVRVDLALKMTTYQSKAHTAGPKWFDMPSQPVTPTMRREIQAMRLHGVLDPKRFLRGEAKRERQALPEFFQIGHILPTRHPASTGEARGSGKRKKNFVDELVEDAQARTRARKQFAEVQAKAASGGKLHYARLKAARRSSKK